ATRVVSTTINWSMADRLKPRAWARNRTAPAWYRAVPSLLKLVPTQAASWLDCRETPSGPVRARRVIGMVAAVLAVLKVAAITSAAPRRNFAGEMPPKIAIWTRYQATWQARPASTTTM